MTSWSWVDFSSGCAVCMTGYDCAADSVMMNVALDGDSVYGGLLAHVGCYGSCYSVGLACRIVDCCWCWIIGDD